jgi:hypothetical protein
MPLVQWIPILDFLERFECEVLSILVSLLLQLAIVEESLINCLTLKLSVFLFCSFCLHTLNWLLHKFLGVSGSFLLCLDNLLTGIILASVCLLRRTSKGQSYSGGIRVFRFRPIKSCL